MFGWGKDSAQEPPAVKMPKSVSAMTIMELDMIMDATMGKLADLNDGAIPTTPAVIKAAQATLTQMGVEGNLKDREAEVVQIIDRILGGEDDESAPPPKPIVTDSDVSA